MFQLLFGNLMPSLVAILEHSKDYDVEHVSITKMGHSRERIIGAVTDELDIHIFSLISF